MEGVSGEDASPHYDELAAVNGAELREITAVDGVGCSRVRNHHANQQPP